MTDHFKAIITRNNGGGSMNHLSTLQDGNPYRHVNVYGQNSGEQGDTNDNVIPIVFVSITILLVILRMLCCSLQKEPETGRVNRVGQPPPPPPSSRAGGFAFREPYTVDAVEVAPVPAVEEQLVCTYRKADGWADDSCGVCLAELVDGEALRVLPACMHFFHATCVNEWLRGHDTCPVCRARLVAPDPINTT